MPKKKFVIIGLIIIGIVVVIFINSLIKKKEKDTRALFKNEIMADLKEGYSVKDTIFESLDGKNQHVIAVIHWEAEGGLDQQDSLVVFELKGEKLIEIYNSTEWIFKLGNELEGDYFRAEDINKDDLREFVITRSQGGNCWTCISLRIFQVRGHKVIELLSHLPVTQAIYGIMDLDSDGIKELIVLDAEWEFYMELCHACSPSMDIIYTWEKANYKEASNKFSAYYENKIKEIKNQIVEMGEKEKGSDYYIGKSVSLFLNYVQKGEKEKGWRVFKNFMNEENFKEKAFRNTARGIVRDLEKKFFKE